MAECKTCLDTGYVCDVCREADGECSCTEGPQLVECDECDREPTDEEIEARRDAHFEAIGDMQRDGDGDYYRRDD